MLIEVREHTTKFQICQQYHRVESDPGEINETTKKKVTTSRTRVAKFYATLGEKE